MVDDFKKDGNKAVGIAGGSGVGAILIQLAEMVNSDYRNIYIACVPFIAVLLSEFFTFITALVSLDPKMLRIKIRLKIIKWKLYWGMRKDIKPELKELARQRYDTIIGIEMGVYSLDDFFNTIPKPPDAKESAKPIHTPPVE
ncbi:hypothetical protein [Providencia sp. PROV020]|uniref:hypothetical protein n=1 Tax=unclassified Providencia TaxID=2633465 RepID=UPI002349BE56|nr:hypothetical protein [Providencia sp. PROV020]